MQTLIKKMMEGSMYKALGLSLSKRRGRRKKKGGGGEEGRKGGKK
jgi:hypothetical protein